MVEAIAAPAWVRNGRSDFMASNRLARALYAPVFDQIHSTHGPVRSANTARFAFLDQRARTFYVDWERIADDIVAVLRAEAGRNPYDRGLTDLVGSCRRAATTSGPLGQARRAFPSDRVQAAASPGGRGPGPDLRGDGVPVRPRPDPARQHRRDLLADRDALTLLASWAATLEQADATHARDGA